MPLTHDQSATVAKIRTAALLLADHASATDVKPILDVLLEALGQVEEMLEQASASKVDKV